MMAAPSFSQMSTKTVSDFGEYKTPLVRALLSIDDWAIPGGGIHYNLETFSYESFNFYMQYGQEKEGKTILTLAVHPTLLAEYQLLYQLRIRVGHGEDPQETDVVDRLVVGFQSDEEKPLTVIVDEGISFVKLELRTINKLLRPHPKFVEGDVALHFKDGGSLATWKGLLALASPLMAECLSDPSCDGLNVGDFPKNAMVELLLQLHPIRRPVTANFVALAKAAVGYKVKPIIYKLSKHLLDISFRLMSMDQKWALALETELFEAFQELVWQSVEHGHWDHRLKEGWKPETHFSSTVYGQLVAPVVAAARGQSSSFVRQPLEDPWNQPNYFQPGPHKVSVYFRGTEFYVNKAVLQLQGLQEFQVAKNGTLAANFSKQMQYVCGKTDVVPGKVLIALLDSLHPGGPPVEAKYLRGAIVFSADHQWSLAKEDLEQRLLLEPVDKPQLFLEQMLFSETFGLFNMLRVCFFRAEGLYNSLVAELAAKKFPGLSEMTRNILVDRVCSGWGLYPKIVNNLAVMKGTDQLERQVSATQGGPAEAAHDEPTMAEVLSEYIYGPLTEFTRETVLEA